MLKRLLAAFAIVLLLFLVSLFLIGLLLPSRWKVEASTTIAAPPAAVWPHVSRLSRWSAWSPWNQRFDKDVKWTVTGEDGAPGATLTWEGEKTGSGSLTLTRLDEPRRVEYESKMHAMPKPARGSITLEPVGNRTLVRWVDEGDVGSSILSRYLVIVMPIAVRHDFDRGLAALRQQVETSAP